MWYKNILFLMKTLKYLAKIHVSNVRNLSDNKKSLQSHIRHVHEQKQIKCAKCNKILKSSLERHMNKVHKVFSGRFSR